MFGRLRSIEIDNSAAERALRVVALGRKNYPFAGSDAGGERAAPLTACSALPNSTILIPNSIYAMSWSASPIIRRVAQVSLLRPGVRRPTKVPKWL